MIPRYAPEDLAALFSDEARFGAMLEVELLATEAMEFTGIAPPGTAAVLRAAAPRIDADFVRAVDEREAVTRHDTAAFVDVVQREMGIPEASWVHYGLTSSDVVDTALALQLTRVLDVLVADEHRLVAVHHEVRVDGELAAPVLARGGGYRAPHTRGDLADA